MAPTPTKGTPKGTPKPQKLGANTPKPNQNSTPGKQTAPKATPSQSTPGNASKAANNKATPAKNGMEQQKQQASGQKPAPNGAQKLARRPAPGPSQAGKAQQAAGKVQDTSDDASEDESDDEPMSKVTQAKDDLQQQAPEPIQDSDAGDAVSGAQQKAKGAADESDDAEDSGDDETEHDEHEDDSDTETQDTANDAVEQAKSSAGGAAKSAKDTAGKAGQDAKSKAKDIGGKAQDAAKEAPDTAKDAAAGAKDQVEDATEEAGETAEQATDEAKDAANQGTEEAQDKAENTKDDAQDKADGVKDEAGDAADDAENAADGAQDEAQEKADSATGDAKESAEGASGEMPDVSSLPLDKSVLKGLTVDHEGMIQGHDGPVGRLAEGDKEDLEGYEIGDDGEILDEDGDLVGRCELLPAEIKRQMAEAKEKGELPDGADDILSRLPNDDAAEHAGDELEQEGPALPGLHVLKGYTCNPSGEVYNENGDKIGEVTEGEAEELSKATLNDNGEFIDDDGNVVGHARVHEEAADAFPDEAAKAAEGADAVEEQLPSVEALEGRELNEAGEIHDADGNVLGHVDEDGDLKQKLAEGKVKAEDLKIDEEGKVVDSEGNVLGSVGLAEGAAEKLKEASKDDGLPDIRILEGKRVNKKGKVLDEEGEEIGELSEGDATACAGKKINEKGEILDKSGEVIGKVKTIHGEAAEAASKQLLEELGETAEEEGPKMITPDLDTLDGYKVNKKGQVIDEDGEVIGELADGELADCAGKKINDKGEVVDKEGNVVGHVKTIAHEATEEEANAEAEQGHDEEHAEGEHEDEDEEHQEGEGEGEPELPPLSDLEGLTVNKAGKLVNDKGTIVGELVDGDAKKLSKSGITCDDQGQFWDDKGHVIGHAKTVHVEEEEEEAPFAGLEGLVVAKDGWVIDEKENKVGRVSEGDAKKLTGRAVDEDGDILDKKGNVVGHAERYTEPEEETPEEETLDLSSLEGRPLNKAGFIMGDDGTPIGRLTDGKAKDLAGKKCDGEGQIWNDNGKVIGRCELIPQEERETKAEGPFAGYENVHVIADGKVADGDENVVGQIVDGNAKRMVGMKVDEDGDIVDKYGNVKGHAEPLADEDEVDYSILDNKQLNKKGFVIDDNSQPIGKLTEGDAKELAGKRCDDKGYLYNDRGQIVGKCTPLPPNERPSKEEGPFAGHDGLHVVKDGWIQDENENVVGKIVEGNAKRLVGMAVDEDGDIVDKHGNVKGHAEPYEEEDEEAEDLSSLAGCTVNKAGNVVDTSGAVLGRVAEGDPKSMIGKKVDGQGQIWDNSGKVIGRAELVHGQDTSPEGPFAGFEGITVAKDGTVVTAGGDIVGRLTEGEPKKLVGHKVDEDGGIQDKNGNEIGKAERWEPEEKEHKVNPMSGRKVNKEGEVRNEDGDIIGRLTEGDLGRCVGNEVDDSGNVVDNDGNKIGEATLLENIAEEEPEEEEMSEEEQQKQQDREVAKKMNAIVTDTTSRMKPICKQINDRMEQADRTPKDELDEDQLVNDVKPLIEEGGRVLNECNGSIRGLDPDGSIAARAKSRSSSGEASPEAQQLAGNLKDLTENIVGTIDGAKKKLQNMPAAKKKLNPLWHILTNPLGQILASIAMLLIGVLNLLGNILGVIPGFKALMGGTGIGKMLGGAQKKAGSALSSVPLVGGMLGGGK